MFSGLWCSSVFAVIDQIRTDNRSVFLFFYLAQFLRADIHHTLTLQKKVPLRVENAPPSAAHWSASWRRTAGDGCARFAHAESCNRLHKLNIVLVQNMFSSFCKTRTLWLMYFLCLSILSIIKGLHQMIPRINLRCCLTR